jgi:hypothetical protein
MEVTTNRTVWLAMLLRGLLGFAVVWIPLRDVPLAVAVGAIVVALPVAHDVTRFVLTTGDRHD